MPAKRENNQDKSEVIKKLNVMRIILMSEYTENDYAYVLKLLEEINELLK